MHDATNHVAALSFQPTRLVKRKKNRFLFGFPKEQEKEINTGLLNARQPKQNDTRETTAIPFPQKWAIKHIASGFYFILWAELLLYMNIDNVIIN